MVELEGRMWGNKVTTIMIPNMLEALQNGVYCKERLGFREIKSLLQW